MSDVPFHQTRMGARFYEHTVPELVRQVERLADAMERIADSHVRAGSQQQPKTENDDGSEERHEDPQPPHE